jgi:site-specific DNA recombinase
METAIYVRVSTEEQATEGFSVRAQEQKLKEYANVKDWSVFNIYLDEGISGKNITERPAINKMIADIKAGHVKNVLVFKLDRLTRSVADLVFLIDLFKENNCDFNSLTESIDTSTASGRMFIKIIGIFAEFERENIGERVRTGKERKAREGFTVASSSISYGFDREIGKRVQTINEREAQIVRMIFDMYVNSGTSLAGISKSLNMQGIPAKKGSLWNAATVRGVLTNCNMVGNVRYAVNSPDRHFESEGKHEAIIADDLYNAAQTLIAKNSRTTPTKKASEKNYFVGLLYCGVCGEKYKPHHTVYNTNQGRQTLYSFQCRNRFLKGGCNTKTVTALKVENALIEYLSKYGDTFNSDTETIATAKENQNITQIQNYKHKLKHYDDKEKEVMNHYINGNIDFENYRKLKNQLDDDRTYIKSELEKLSPPEITGNDAATHVQLEEIVASFQESWQGLTNTEKRIFLTNYVKRIVVCNEPIDGSRFGNTKVTDIEFNAY